VTTTQIIDRLDQLEQLALDHDSDTVADGVARLRLDIEIDLRRAADQAAGGSATSSQNRTAA
jgi:hypothetical protein